MAMQCTQCLLKPGSPHVSSQHMALLRCRALRQNLNFDDQYSVSKTLHLVRHGASEMNAYFALHRYDAPLSIEGKRQVQSLAKHIGTYLKPAPQVILTSPLTRCLQTAEVISNQLQAIGCTVSVEVEPLLRERVTLSSEIGRPPEDLQQEFPNFLFPQDMQEVWWYTAPIVGDDEQAHAGGSVRSMVSLKKFKSIQQEPQDVYQGRLEELQQVLTTRPEQSIVVVSHWGVINYLSGEDIGLATCKTVPDWCGAMKSIA